MIAIYTPQASPRIKYTLVYIFTQRLGLEYVLFTDKAEIGEGYRLKVNYSSAFETGFLNIIPEGLLTEQDYRPRVAELVEKDGRHLLFDNGSDTGFDIFSAIFYCLSRYEEYGDIHTDNHGRFSHTSSFLWKSNALHLPVVDQWLDSFKHLLTGQNGFEEKDFNAAAFNVLPTIDIDSVFAYRGRGFFRQLAGFAKALLKGEFGEVSKRFRVAVLGAKDPNDNFGYQLEQLKKRGLKAHYFFQVGPYGRYDKNIDPSNKDFWKAVKMVKEQGHTIGLHPSYGSNSSAGAISKEKKILEAMAGEQLESSRQHYLRFRLPETYRALAASGIKREFSMGYSEVPGFRAGTSRPFPWYDLGTEKATELMVIPFCAMDVAFKQFMQTGIATTIEAMDDMKAELRKTGGQFCFVYHNESLGGHRGWEGWDKVFEAWLEK